MKENQLFRATVAIPLLIAAVAVAQSCDRTEPAAPATAAATQPVPVVPAPAPAPAAPAYTLRDLKLHGAADLASDKGRTVLFVSTTAPRVKLYDTEASHPVCSVNGKRGQVAEVGRGEYTCYRWIGDTVALRIDNNQWAMLDGDKFRAK